MLPDGAIDSFTRLVLTNAIYFNAAWLQPFDPKKTQAGQFELIDGSTVRVPMMLKTLWSAYAKGEGYQAVDLVYEGGEISMTILLPDKGTFREFEDSLDSAMLGRIVRDLQVERVKLSIPKFGFESGFSLRDTLKGMGMPDAFGDAADFSGMDGRSCTAGDHPCLIVSDVFHKGFVEVDEAGTEAAAATGLVVRVFSEPPEPTPVTVDRPFIFLIRDKKTEAILFLGRIVNPEKT